MAHVGSSEAHVVKALEHAKSISVSALGLTCLSQELSQSRDP